MNALAEEARKYAAEELYVLPLHGIRDGNCTCKRRKCTSPGKHPRTGHGVKDATRNRDTIASWWEKWPDANVGIATGRVSNFVVLDVDPRNQGDDTLAKLEKEHGALPSTLVSDTGGGGKHFLFSYPPGGVSSGKPWQGIDLQSDGAYIVAPPSLHVSGVPYRWRKSSAPQLAELPDWIIGNGNGPRPGADKPEVPITEVPEPEEGSRWHLDDPRKHGLKRHDHLRDFVMALRNHHERENVRALAFALAEKWGMLEERRAEVEKLVQSAYEKPPLPVETEYDRYHQTPGLAPRCFDVVGAVAEEANLPPVPYGLRHPDDENQGLLVDGDVTIISAEGKSGKSSIMLAVAAAYTLDVPLGGFLKPERAPRRVLYIDAEQNERLLQRRWPMLVRGLDKAQQVKEWGDDPLLAYVWGDRYNLDTKEGFRAVKRLVREKQPSLVIFDSFVRFTRKSLLEADKMSSLYMERYRPLRDMVDGGIVLLAHMRKRSEGSNDLGQRLYGSVDLRNLCDSHIALRRRDYVVEVVHEATRWDEIFPRFCLRLDLDLEAATARFVYEEDQKSSQGLVCAWLQEAGTEGLRRQEIVSRLHQSGAASTLEAAGKMATRILKQLREDRTVGCRQERNAARYWAKEFAPQDVETA